MKPTSIRQLAARCGCSHTAIAKAVREHRLTAGVTIADDAIAVTDADAAVDQWRQISQPRPKRRSRECAAHDNGVPPYEVSRARREAANAELAERELAAHKGEYLETEIVRRDVMNKFAIVRTRLLAVPSNVAQRIAGVASPDVLRGVVAVVDDLIREALAELATRADEP